MTNLILSSFLETEIRSSWEKYRYFWAPCNRH